MANRIFDLEADLCQCAIVAPDGREHRLSARRIGDQSCRIESDIELPANEYVDVRVALEGVGEQPLFAHVVGSGDDGLTLRWLHFDPGDAIRLEEALTAFGEKHGLESKDDDLAVGGDQAASSGKKGKSRKRETRRVVRPRSSGVGEAEDDAAGHTRRVTRPAQADDVEPLFPDDELPAEAEGEGKKTTAITPFGGRSERRGTRKVVRPQQSTAADDADLAPTDSADAPSGARGAIDGDAPGQESGGRHVVLEQTENFKKLPTEDQQSAGSGQGSASGRQSVTVRRNIRGDDGKLDVGASIRSRSKTVRASELAARHDKVRVLNMSTIKELIQDAVQEALDRLGGSIDEAEKRRLLEEAEEEFQERLKAFNAEKKGWAAQQKNLENQLERAQRMLEDERQKQITADQFTVSEGGLEDLEKRFERLVAAAIKAEGVNEVLADELRGMVSTVLDEEREKIAEQARQAQSDAIALLEKKVGRLASSLEESEKERDRARRHAAALEAAGGGVSGQAIFSEFADEEDKARKLELLKVVFEQNKEMRQQLKKQGVVIKARKKPKSPAATSEGESAEGVEDAEGEAGPAAAAPEPAAAAEESAAAAEEPATAEEPVAATADEAAEGEDPYADMVDPDDMPWQPGMTVQTDVAGDNEAEEDDGGIKKITAADTQIAPPPLELKAAGGSAADAAPESGDEEVADDSYDGSLDPDDMPWQPGMKVQTDIAGDNEDEDDDGGVKKVAAASNQLEPPPITIRKPGG